MPAELFQFSWGVAEGGYSWLEADPLFPIGGNAPTDVPAVWLTDGQPAGVAGFRVQRYRPLTADPALFRVFAETEPTREGIQAFANRYGLLGGNTMEAIRLPRHPGDDTAGYGVPLWAWLEEIRAMRQMVELWDLAAQGNERGLARLIAWSDTGVAYRPSGKGAGKRHPSEVPIVPNHPDLLGQFPRGDLVLPALYHIQETVNKHIEGRISPRLLWGKDHSRLGIYLVPDSLIGALWLQFARAIDGEKQYRRCLACGAWFELSPDTARTNRRYCNDACRSKAYRARKARGEANHGQEA